MDPIMAFYSAHQTAIFAVLFFLSEALAQIPAVKSNSIFQLIFGWLSKKQLPPS